MLLTINLTCSNSLLPGNNGTPKYNSAKMHPVLQRSILVSYETPKNISGAR